MQILKYLFLLCLLSIFTTSVFIATQKSEYKFEVSKVVSVPKDKVFAYVNDFSNWKNFGYWTINEGQSFLKISDTKFGQNSLLNWQNSETFGEISILSKKDGDTIAQKLQINQEDAEVKWIFKDTLGGTKISCLVTGNDTFLTKVANFFDFGEDRMVYAMVENSLQKLAKLNFTQKSFYKIAEPIELPMKSSFFVGQTFTCEIKKILHNFKIVVPKLTKFCNDNSLVLNGKPFVKYQTYDTIKGITKVTIGVPIAKQIGISAGSEIVSGKLDSIAMIKINFRGDFSFLHKIDSRITKYTSEKNWKLAREFSHIAVFSNSILDSEIMQEWTAEVYYPVVKKVSPKKIVTPSTEQPTIAAPAPAQKTEDTEEFNF